MSSIELPMMKGALHFALGKLCNTSQIKALMPGT